MDRAILLSDSEFYMKNLTIIINILLNNDYLLKLIFDTINKRLQRIRVGSATCVNRSNKNEDLSVVQSWFTVPFIPSLTEKFNQFNRNDIKVSFYSLNKLQKYIKVHKDPRPQFSKNNIVYRITCNNYDASYVEDG